MSSQEANVVEKKVNFMDSFINGAKKGTSLVFGTVIPNVIFAFALTRVLTISGLLEILGKVCSPLMGLLGLPGEAAVPLIMTLPSMTAGVTSTAALVESGVLTGTQALSMFPALFLSGSIIMYTGRILAVCGLPAKEYKVCYIICILNSILSIYVMKVILAFL